MFNWKWFCSVLLGALIGSLLLFLMMAILSKKVYADTYKDLSIEFNQIFAEQLTVKIQHLPKKSFVEISLKDGSVIRGTFEGFQKYDDSIWILPQEKSSIFSDKAYDVRELQDVKVIVQHRV